jgi:isoaspartyl peptidase/L-asparaginase-like protein (Ntn-hydrolase superfamily)
MEDESPCIVVHGGAGCPNKHKDGCESAAREGFEILGEGGSALDAVEAATLILEDDPRYNAGIGSYYSLNRIIEMDASIMDSHQNCGAVAAIRDVRHPISVARKVMEETPHILLMGRGANKFADIYKFEKCDLSSQKAIDKLEKVKEKLGKFQSPKWNDKWKNVPWQEYLHGTVGVVARDQYGRFAAANSSGGTSWKLPGRVGDSAVIGAGIYAGPCGAVVATGIGEECIRKVISKEIYDKLGTMHAQKACEWGVEQFDSRFSIGLVAVGKDSHGVACNREMAGAVLEFGP